ncbi:unnamed protein product [Brachionus calyciflorus]|uniref:Uncharacterized protein n=1 Tax=Brachionus calyciflorus TaxID=104777 RepID=A0A813YZD0_9BILA|nr:unnamed protein product [Brachionus calyciflorus]
MNELQIRTLKFIKRVKIRRSTEDLGSNKIFEEEQNRLFKTLSDEKEKEGKYTKCSNGIDNFLIYFLALKRAAIRHNLTLNPQKIMTDLELAAINAFKKALLKNVSKLGFKTDYDDNVQFYSWFRRLFCLSYFEGSFQIELWNHYETVGPKTNNSLEGYNKKLKDHVSRAHPSIYKSKEIFQTQETNAFVKYKHALEDKPAPPRKKLDIGKDNDLRIFKKMLSENSIDIEVYIKQVMTLFSFKSNKKNASNDDEDEDVFDSSDEEEE